MDSKRKNDLKDYDDCESVPSKRAHLDAVSEMKVPNSSMDVKGYRKKLRKKEQDGRISTEALLRDCKVHDVNVSAAVQVSGNKQANAGHDVSLEDLRTLVMSVVVNEKFLPPLRFEVKNRAKLKGVVLMHFSNCADFGFIDKLCTSWKAQSLKMRISCEVSRNYPFPERFFTLSKDDIEADTEVVEQDHLDVESVNRFEIEAIEQKMAEYVLTQNQMITWGYPLPYNPDGMESIEYASGLQERVAWDSYSKSTSLLMESLHLKTLYRAISTIPTEQETQKVVCDLPKISVKLQDGRGSLVEKVYDGFLETLPFRSDDVGSNLDQNVLWGDKKVRCQRPISILALDCEMCDTEDGLELARVTLLDKLGVTVLDALALPRKPIIDYRTPWSGISEETLLNVTTTFEQARLAVLRAVSAETILIGHSLDNDLRALKIIHRCCVDTCVMYPHPRGFPFRQSLKYITKKYLDKEIQNYKSSKQPGTALDKGSESKSGDADAMPPPVQLGHDSVEDAHAALMLAILKANCGKFLPITESSDVDSRLSLCDYLFTELKALDIGKSIRSTFLIEEHNVANKAWIGSRSHLTVLEPSTNLSRASAKMQAFIKCVAKDELDIRAIGFIGFSMSGGTNFEDLSALSELSGDGSILLVVTAQTDLTKVGDLSARKRSLSKKNGSMCVTTWNDKLEAELKSEQKRANIGRCIIRVI